MVFQHRLLSQDVIRLSARLFIDGLIMILLVGSLASLYLQTLAPGVTWANNGADSGDLITAAATMGVAHPTGYPTYVLLVRLFQYIPVGDLAFRANLCSAVLALLTVAGVYGLTRSLLVPISENVHQPGATTLQTHPSERGSLLHTLCWTARYAASFAALGLGLSSVFWSQAVVAEVYSLNALFVVLLLLLTWQSLSIADTPRWSGLIAGLALGNHVTIALPIAVWVLTTGNYAPWRIRWQLVVYRLLWVATGLLVYLYLPLRAATHPPVNWGHSVDWAGFWWVVAGQPYHGLAFGVAPAFWATRLTAWATLLVQQFGLVGVALGFYGWLYAPTHSRPLVWRMAIIAGGYSIFALTYDTADSYAYLIPVYVIFAVWIGLGMQLLLTHGLRWRRTSALLLAGVPGVMLLWSTPATLRQVDASQDRRAIMYAQLVLTTAPEGALITTQEDRDTFPLWYYHYALGQRPDIAVVVTPLLEYAWYRQHLGKLYPALQIPEQPESGWYASLIAANIDRRPICTVHEIDTLMDWPLDRLDDATIITCHNSNVSTFSRWYTSPSGMVRNTFTVSSCTNVPTC